MIEKPAGVILAGGRSSRMGGMRKALIPLQDSPLLSHVIGRLESQVSPLLLSSEDRYSGLEVFGLPVVPDIVPRYRGPLTGLCSALQYLSDKQDISGKDHSGLLLCPCDAPFIPPDLAERLVDATRNNATREKIKPVVVVAYEGELQPTFSLWQNHHLPVIHDAVVNRGDGGLKHMLKSLPHVIVEWVSEQPPPFYNVNTPEELEVAEQWLSQKSG
jgi:molybdopterin-guanine dinucleotide biosynthesis protein A